MLFYVLFSFFRFLQEVFHINSQEQQHVPTFESCPWRWQSLHLCLQELLRQVNNHHAIMRFLSLLCIYVFVYHRIFFNFPGLSLRSSCGSMWTGCTGKAEAKSWTWTWRPPIWGLWNPPLDSIFILDLEASKIRFLESISGLYLYLYFWLGGLQYGVYWIHPWTLTTLSFRYQCEFPGCEREYGKKQHLKEHFRKHTGTANVGTGYSI